jgi:hypothetical protein
MGVVAVPDVVVVESDGAVAAGAGADVDADVEIGMEGLIDRVQVDEPLVTATSHGVVEVAGAEAVLDIDGSAGDSVVSLMVGVAVVVVEVAVAAAAAAVVVVVVVAAAAGSAVEGGLAACLVEEDLVVEGRLAAVAGGHAAHSDSKAEAAFEDSVDLLVDCLPNCSHHLEGVAGRDRGVVDFENECPIVDLVDHRQVHLADMLAGAHPAAEVRHLDWEDRLWAGL